MSQSRPKQRGARRKEGGAYSQSLAFGPESKIRAREEGLRQGGVGRKPSAFSQKQVPNNSNEEWKRATEWEPADSTDFALDPDGDWYNVKCSRKVTTEDLPPPQPQIPKKSRSKVSVCAVFCSRNCFS